MSRPSELERLLTRIAPLTLLGAVAKRGACEVAVCGPAGRPVDAPPGLSEVRVTGAAGAKRVEGVQGAAAVAEVCVFDRPAGYVVARATDGRSSMAEIIAQHGADLLSALCSREYELNDLSREILASYEELNLFYDLAAELSGAPDVDAICAAVLDKARRVIQAHRGWILVGQDEGRSFRVVAIAGVDDPPSALMAEPSLAARVLAAGTVENVDDIGQLDVTELGDLERLSDRSIVSVPLCVPGGDGRAPFGVLQLVDKVGSARHAGTGPDAACSPAEPFTAGDVKLAQALGSQAAILIENTRLAAYEREMRIARTIQQSLLPGDPPEVPGLDIAGACEVASNVGGDYYDHLRLDDDRVALLLADVSGHNLAAALMQTAVRSTIRAAILAGGDPVQVLNRANEALYDDLSRADLFLTGWLGFVDAEAGTLLFGDAGHHPALLFRASNGRVERLKAGGVPIGVLRDGLYEQAQVRIEPGDVLVVYTDGLTEARSRGPDPEEYGEDRLVAALCDVAHRSANEILQHLLGAVSLFDEGQAAGDDRTLLALKVIERDSR